MFFTLAKKYACVSKFEKRIASLRINFIKKIVESPVFGAYQEDTTLFKHKNLK